MLLFFADKTLFSSGCLAFNTTCNNTTDFNIKRLLKIVLFYKILSTNASGGEREAFLTTASKLGRG
jgi:hypothetical protein